MEHPTFYRTIQSMGSPSFTERLDRKDAPTLLLLHGLPSSSRMFEPLFARLADAITLSRPITRALGTATGRTRKNSRIHSITSPRS